ncbi:class I SAM-dependent methyltransferase [Lysobacter solisilvae (ex Woo and Kim 2022)]|uniref:class I SAM-dependent methyltransferase n=1 Tax=Agrilutibacter terrestris TaxID=2865112 RepID=UPI001F19DE3B|nr:class I SAM-dependent methyltransferase [Lysobacter terrestris]
MHATDPSAQQVAQHWAFDSSFPRRRESKDVDPSKAKSMDSRLRGNDGQGDITLAVESGERTTLPDASVQLVAVAQALHWFDRAAFFAECARVLAPGGVLAAWGYGDFVAPEGMVEEVADFRALIEPYWPPERALVDAHYAGFDWPFPSLPAPPLWLEAEWSLPHFLRYLSSMSATARCRADLGEDPVARHAPALARAWGEADDLRTLRWPLFLHLRRKP